MGTIPIRLQRNMSVTQMRSPKDLFEVVNDNGFRLCDQYIPEELLSILLSYVPCDELVFNCRLVCKSWCNIIDSQVWRIKFGRTSYPVSKYSELPWFASFWILTKSPLNRNLVKNGCEGLNHWNVLSSGGDRWTIECPPTGCDDLPAECSEEIKTKNSCFATSYYSCSKDQFIELKCEGAVPQFMDEVQPNITVSEWYCGRFDCKGIYELTVTLLDENKDPLDDYEIRKNVGETFGRAWQKASHVFHGYGTGVRFVRFYHAGMDSRFWLGHYGSKMTGASVVLSLPTGYITLPPQIAFIIQLTQVSHRFENYGRGIRYVKIFHAGQDAKFWKGHYGAKMTGTSVVLSLP